MVTRSEKGPKSDKLQKDVKRKILFRTAYVRITAMRLLFLILFWGLTEILHVYCVMPDGVQLCGNYLTAVVGMYIILECVYSYILARKNYNPLRRVVDYANSILNDEEDYQNEYKLIDIAFRRLEAKVGKMKTTDYQYKQKMKKEILQKLLYGDGNQISKDELKEADIVWGGDVFCVISISFNHLEALKEIYSYSDMKLFCFTMINVMEEYLGNAGYTVYGVDNGDYSVSLIMQLEEEYEKSREYALETFPLENIIWIQKLLYGAKQKLEKILSLFTVFISVGRSVKRYEAIHRSWLDTQYATIYRFTRGDDVIVLFTHHMEFYESGIQYPWDIEKKLLINMKASKEESILSVLEEFFSAIQKMAPDEMRWAINQIMTSIFRASMAGNYRMKDGNPLDWKSWVNEMNATDTKYEMKDVLSRLLKNISIEEEKTDSVRKKLADMIKAYVDEHFCDDMLTVSDIAVQVGYSVNYVRQVFKEICGISVSDYILDKRIEKAQELLVNTNYTCNRIAQMVGYSDNRYFYVVFKKKTGETADNFRKKNM